MHTLIHTGLMVFYTLYEQVDLPAFPGSPPDFADFAHVSRPLAATGCLHKCSDAASESVDPFCVRYLRRCSIHDRSVLVSHRAECIQVLQSVGPLAIVSSSLQTDGFPILSAYIPLLLYWQRPCGMHPLASPAASAYARTGRRWGLMPPLRGIVQRWRTGASKPLRAGRCKRGLTPGSTAYHAYGCERLGSGWRLSGEYVIMKPGSGTRRGRDVQAATARYVSGGVDVPA